MQQIDPIPSKDHEIGTTTDGAVASQPAPGRIVRHLKLTSLVVLGLLGLALLPPLINVNRFQRRIATSIGGSLGRPVHFSSISLSMLPLPGFEIRYLVVDEDPAFGFEPIIRADTVRATLRLSSLWRRRVEFSTISFTEPSLNLVHAADGRWNIEGILLQATHIDTAPTAQRRAGPAPRFPYIEATGARLNFKQGLEKMPFSLTDSDFSLWAPDPNQWQLRLRAHPARTDSARPDSNVSSTGVVDVEGTLGRGDSLSHIPINLETQWRDAPLGEASRLLTGQDAGWRGNVVLTANIRGTFGENAVSSRLRLLGVRRADFVPQQPLAAEIECHATAIGVFHSYQDLRCAWPPNASAAAPTIALTGEIPDVRNLRRSKIQFGSTGIPASTVVDWLRIASPRISPGITADGVLTGSMIYDGEAANNPWSGQAALHAVALKTSEAGDSLLSGDVVLHTVETAGSEHRLVLDLEPVNAVLGGRDPATLEGHFDTDSYTLHLTGMATESRLREFTAAMAPLSTGLVEEAPVQHAAGQQTAQQVEEMPARADVPERVDISTSGAWNGPHTWSSPASHQVQTSGSRKTR